MPAAVDPTKSYIDRVRVRGDVLNIRSHVTYLVAHPAAPTLGPQPVSLVLGHSLVVLPERPMAPRFGDPRVGRALDGVLLLRADVTRSDVAQRAFMQRLQVMGPPTLMLYAPQGEERRDQRLVGEFGPEALLERLQTGSTGS